MGFWKYAEEDPGYLAIVDPDGTEHTAGDVLARANQVVHGLRSLGLERGDAVAAVLPNGSHPMHIYLAALQGIPGELYESAELDGAGILRRVWHITVPQTRLILSLMLLLQIIGTMQVFLEPYIITGASNDTTTVVYLIYQYAFNFNNYGSASALGVVLLLVLIGFAGGYLWLSRRLGEED